MFEVLPVANVNEWCFLGGGGGNREAKVGEMGEGSYRPKSFSVFVRVFRVK